MIASGSTDEIAQAAREHEPVVVPAAASDVASKKIATLDPPSTATADNATAPASAPSSSSTAAPNEQAVPQQARALPAASSTARRTPWGSACTSPALPAQRPPYLAAGVLPFCVLGGDLLFLLGQQLRFRSRVRDSSFSEMDGVSTSVGGGGDARGKGGGVGECGVELKPYPNLKTGSLKRPRRAPRPKLSPPPMPVPPPLAPDKTRSLRPCHPRVNAALSKFGAEALPEALTSHPATPASSVRSIAIDEAVSPRGLPLEGAVVACKTTQPGVLVSMSQQSPQVGNLLRAGADVAELGSIACGTAATGVGGAGWHSEAESTQHGASVALADRCRGKATTDDGKTQRQKANAAAMDGVAPAAAAAAATAEREIGRSWFGQAPSAMREQGSVPAGLLWSDFGGAREAGDEGAEGTASREFAEESFGLFHGVRLESDSVARSQAAMESMLRDPYLRGKRVFECRNGGYVMFIAEVDFVPDIMMKLARKEVVDGRGGDDGGGGADVAGVSGTGGLDCVERATSPGFSEKTDFAWVPASSLLQAMRESRHRSTRKVVVKLGGCRYLRLFHKFVISLWGLDLAAVIAAASTPLHRRTVPFPAPRILLLRPGRGHRSPRGQAGSQGCGGSRSGKKSNDNHDQNRVGGSSSVDGLITPAGGTAACAIRGIDCIRPSFLSGRKRTNLGIIDERCDRRAPSARRMSTGGVGGGSGRGSGSSAAAGDGSDTAGVDSGSDAFDNLEGDWPVAGDRGGGGGRGCRGRGRRSGAACRKRRRQRKEARRLKAVAAAVGAATAAASVPAMPSAAMPRAVAGGVLDVGVCANVGIETLSAAVGEG